MSGHFATLLRGTVETFLPEHEVYITDWQDARNVPQIAGSFDLDDYIDTMVAMFRFFGGDVHVFAVCQPSVPVLAATALMEAEDDPAVPLTLVLAGGPVDTRINRTVVNTLAEKRGTDWFRRNVITNVPWPCPGRGRQVYPGFLQLSGFMTMNLDRHMQAQKDMFLHLVHGDGDSADKHREFYDEYLAVMDLTAEFYLQTVDTVFVQHLMPRGLMTSRGRPVDLAAIRRPALMTVEGEKDDITGTGQCRAALDLCTGIPPAQKIHFECPKVGHYGVFNGSRFRTEIAPRMAKFMRAHDPCAASDLTIAQPQLLAFVTSSGASYVNRWDDFVYDYASVPCFTSSPLTPGDAFYLGFADSLGGNVVEMHISATIEGLGGQHPGRHEHEKRREAHTPHRRRGAEKVRASGGISRLCRLSPKRPETSAPRGGGSGRRCPVGRRRDRSN